MAVYEDVVFGEDVKSDIGSQKSVSRMEKVVVANL